MDVWKHSRLSARKFGGDPADYAPVHAFLDSSKLFCYHIRHRLLLHNLFGIELAMRLFGDFIRNDDGDTVLVRDIAAAHCREDLAGRVPTLYDWLRDSPQLEDFIVRSPDDLPESGDQEVDEFARAAFRRTGLRAALALGYSDFGVALVERFFGVDRAERFARVVEPRWKIKDFLEQFRFTGEWQYSPQPHEIAWLKNDAAQSRAARDTVQ